MKYFFNYRFTVGAISILAGILALVCLLVGAITVEYNFDAFSDPLLTLNYAGNYNLAKWFNLLDMFGYYLLLLPLVFYCYQQHKYKSPWAPLITFSGVAYVLIGAIGAAILAAIWPELMIDYTKADPQDQAIIRTVFKATTILVTTGLWNILEVLFAAVWWIGLGKFLLVQNKALGVLTIVTGVSCLIDSTGTMTGIKLLSDIGLNVYLLLGILWPIIVGFSLIRMTVESKSAKTFQRKMQTQTQNENV